MDAFTALSVSSSTSLPMGFGSPSLPTGFKERKMHGHVLRATWVPQRYGGALTKPSSTSPHRPQPSPAARGGGSAKGLR
eukprot:6786820-Prymnesium_polylepis.1